MLEKTKKLLRKNIKLFDFSRRVYRKLGFKNPTYRLFQELETKNKFIKFIQIGANDGITDDCLREFALRDNWEGILIEPVPYIYKMLIENYKSIKGLKFKNIAIGNRNEILKFWIVDKEKMNGLTERERRAASCISSFDKEHLLKHVDFVPDIDNRLTTIKVGCVSFEDILKEFNTNIDLIFVDAEGFERIIINDILKSRVCFNVLIFEIIHLTEDKKNEIYRELGKSEYLIYEANFDAICIAKKLNLAWEEGKRIISTKSWT